MQASQARIDVLRDGDTIVVEACAFVDGDSTTTWQTLSAYDRLADFIPGMAVSRTVARDGTRVLVEQRAQASFGPFRREFTLLLAVEETPCASIRASAAGGDFKTFDALYRLTDHAEGGTRIDYTARLEPVAGVPPLVGLPVMRGLVRRQFEAMLGEIGRRAAAGA